MMTDYKFVWQFVCKIGLHTFFVQLVQYFQTTDGPLRATFCRYLRQQYVNNPKFVVPILFTGEAHFTPNGMVSLQCARLDGKEPKSHESHGIRISLLLMFEMTCYVPTFCPLV
jgi:hypothetical protein